MGPLEGLAWKEPIRVEFIGRWGLSISTESSCYPPLGPLSSTRSEGSGNTPDVGLVGYLVACQPGPTCGHLLNQQKVWWFFLLSFHLREFTSGWETGFLAPLVSKGCLGVVPINYQTLSLWALSGSVPPLSLISANYLS